jgi:transposase
MAYNFLRTDRDQPFLLPPNLLDWLPEGHLAWFVLDVVDQLDLQPFLRCYRADGHGHPAYDPKALLGVLLYAYATGGALLPADRTALPRGPRLPGAGRQPAP